MPCAFKKKKMLIQQNLFYITTYYNACQLLVFTLYIYSETYGQLHALLMSLLSIFIDSSLSPQVLYKTVNNS